METTKEVSISSRKRATVNNLAIKKSIETLKSKKLQKTSIDKRDLNNSSHLDKKSQLLEKQLETTYCRKEANNSSQLVNEDKMER